MYDVITIGTATRDAFLLLGTLEKGKHYNVVRDARFETGAAECFALGAKMTVPDIVFTTGGGATNAAVTFARQRFKTACFCVVGSDVSGETVMRELRKERVDFLFRIDPHAKHKTAYSIILLSPTGERTILVYRGASEDIEESMVPWRKLAARWLYLGPIGGQGNRAFARILAHAHKAGMRIAANPSAAILEAGLSRFSELMKGVQVLIVNNEEAAALTGIPPGNDIELLRALRKATGSIVVMTKGPEGILVTDGRFMYRAGTFSETAVVDRTGAGDAFGAGFVAALMAREKKGKPFSPEDIAYAIRLGSANGTSVVEHIGAKEGILTRRAFAGARWRNLSVDIREL